MACRRGANGVDAALADRGANTRPRHPGQTTAVRRCCSTTGFTSGSSIRLCTLTLSAGRSGERRERQTAVRARGRPVVDDRVGILCNDAAVRLCGCAAVRLWPSCPGFAPPGRDCSRRSFRSVEGGLDDVRDVLAGRCSFSTSLISSSLLRRSRSPRLMPTGNQPSTGRASHRCTAALSTRRRSPHAAPWALTVPLHPDILLPD